MIFHPVSLRCLAGIVKPVTFNTCSFSTYVRYRISSSTSFSSQNCFGYTLFGAGLPPSPERTPTYDQSGLGKIRVDFKFPGCNSESRSLPPALPAHRQYEGTPKYDKSGLGNFRVDFNTKLFQICSFFGWPASRYRTAQKCRNSGLGTFRVDFNTTLLVCVFVCVMGDTEMCHQYVACVLGGGWE